MQSIVTVILDGVVGECMATWICIDLILMCLHRAASIGMQKQQTSLLTIHDLCIKNLSNFLVSTNQGRTSQRMFMLAEDGHAHHGFDLHAFYHGNEVQQLPSMFSP